MPETPPYRLYEPLNVPKPVAENIWIVDGPSIRMAFGPLRVPFPTRMTLVRLEGGDLFAHSPIAPTPALLEAVSGLGRVRHLVSPNAIHYAHIAAWKDSFPDATAWASPGVRARAASQNISVSFDADLTDAPPPAWAGEIDQLVFRGSRILEEVVFFHVPTRTLVLTDLIENFEADRVAWPWRWLVRLAGAMEPDGKAPRDLRATFTGRKHLARACLERMLAWAPERVLLAHGHWYPSNARAELERAFRWLR